MDCFVGEEQRDGKKEVGILGRVEEDSGVGKSKF